MTLTTVNPALLDTQAQYTGFKNRIINGAMAVSQYYGTGSTTTAGYVIDRFTALGSTGTFTWQQTSSIVPTGFAYAESITVTSAGTRLATDYFGFIQNIEGLSVSDLGFGAASATTVTISFWVRSSVTGTYSGVLQSGDNTRCYGFTYSIPSANTWTQISVTIAGDTSGGQTAYPINNTSGLRLKLDLGSGSNYQVTAGSWQAAANKIGTSSQVGWAQTAGATFYITGVQLEKGSTATSFDYRPYGTELALCQRYYWQISENDGNSIFWIGAVNSALSGRMVFPFNMRSTPTVTFDAALYINDATANALVNAATARTAVSGGGVSVLFSSASSVLTLGRAASLYGTGSTTPSFVGLSSEL